MPKHKILISLTTITKNEWRKKVKEIDKLGLKEIALFLTCLNFKERQELYQLLENTKLINIPHVHLRNDMKISELDYLNNKFKTEIFNIHSESSFHSFLFNYLDFAKKIYVENQPGYVPTNNELKKYAGLCLDIGHWESVRLNKGEESQENKEMKKIVKKYKIAVNHISAIKPKKTYCYDRFSGKNIYCYDSHLLDNLSELNYVKKYKNYLANVISIELENSLVEQLEAKNYLEKILDFN